MLTAIPDPLTPADCDLQDFKFMPLDVARLRDSDMASEQTPEENWAAVLLWSAAWHQVPAASMPDSDNWIAKAAGYMMRGRIDPRWKDVRPGAMRGFVLCSDGRWYHQVVAEKANDSWVGKLKQRLKTECARIKKHNDRHGIRIPFPDFELWFAAGCPVGQPLPVPSDDTPLSLGTILTVPRDTPPLSLDEIPNVPTKTPSKGEGEGEGQGEGQGELTSKAEASSQASIEVREGLPIELPNEPPRPPAAAAPPQAIGRNVAISILLRAGGIDATSQNPLVCLDWAENPKVTDELLSLAVVKARAAKPDQARIHVNYLKNIVAELVAAPEAKARADDRAWRMSDGGIERKGRELGMFARGGESHRDFAGRIDDEIRKRKGSGK